MAPEETKSSGSNNERATFENTAVLVPAYNAARHLGHVLAEVKSVIGAADRILVVNDGSADDTSEVAGRAGVIVIEHEVNQGKGVALQTGIDAAIDRSFAFVISLDADGQHDPAEIPSFINRQQETGADMIIGNRMTDRGDMPGLRVFANKATSMFVSLMARARVPDSQNGYRMLRTSLFRTIRLETKRYDAESEMLIKAGRRGARIESVPVRTIYGDEVSGVNPFIDTLRFFRMALKSLFW